MPDEELTVVFNQTRAERDRLGLVLAPLAERMATQTIIEVLPGAAALEVRGEINEDWIPVLRIRRVLGPAGLVLFGAAEGHDDPAVEDAIDLANIEYLDLLLDLTGDTYMGSHTIAVRTP